MSDDKTIQGYADAPRVNVNAEQELRYWARRFGCTEAELKAAVKAVGTVPANVEAHFAAKWTVPGSVSVA